MTDKWRVHPYLKISVVWNDPSGAALFLISVFCFLCKVVTLRILCPDQFQSQTERMTLSGRVVWAPYRLKTQVIPMETAVMVSLANSFNKLSSSREGHLLVILLSYTGCKWYVYSKMITGRTKMMPWCNFEVKFLRVYIYMPLLP